MPDNMIQSYSPRNYGALADGETLATAAFQAAIDACHQSGGGIVHCEPGSYRIGSIELKSGVELYLSAGCTLLASTRIEDYREFVADGFIGANAPESNTLHLIGARNAQRIAITGPGQIDGCGPAFYDDSAYRKSGQFAAKPVERPRVVMLHKCSDVRLTNFTLLDPACWACWLMLCRRVSVSGIRIHAESRLINGDGIDFDGCRDVTVSDCIISAQDDCLVFRAIQQVHEDEAICENFTVTNCVLESDRGGIRISCPNDNIVRNGVFSNLTIRSTSNGIALHFPERFFHRDRPTRAEVRDLLFSNITVECNKSPLKIEVGEGLELKAISGIQFSNLRLTGSQPCLLQGSDKTFVENVTLDRVHIRCAADQALVTTHCRNIHLNSVTLETGVNHRPVERESW